MNDQQPKKCGCMCHKMMGLFIALMGLTFLLTNLGVISTQVEGMVWPILLILTGLQHSFGRGKCKCCAKSGE